MKPTALLSVVAVALLASISGAADRQMTLAQSPWANANPMDQASSTGYESVTTAGLLNPSGEANPPVTVSTVSYSGMDSYGVGKP
ncbi:MAG: hypothetical protein JJ992_07640, partial [Planctomycetes bacterium]|nr:hypothetical protein [Planctomycetota bacterium]